MQKSHGLVVIDVIKVDTEKNQQCEVGRNVTYWPSTQPSIKKQVNPVEDIGISPWSVDAHRKQVDVKQLYNQVP